MKTTTIRLTPMGKIGRLTVIWLMAVLVGLLLGGCAGKINEAMESWKGSHISAVIQSWGPATRTASDGKGGTIYIWDAYVDLGTSPGTHSQNIYCPPSFGGYTSCQGTGTYTPPQQQGYNRVRMFYVDKNGRIYNWRWQGL